MRLALASAALCALAVCAPSLAQAPDFQGQHNDWRVFTRGSGAERICYAVSRPTDSRPGTVDHGDVYFFVSSWANGAAREQPSFLAGYELRADNPPRASVGSDRVGMYVDERARKPGWLMPCAGVPPCVSRRSRRAAPIPPIPSRYRA